MTKIHELKVTVDNWNKYLKPVTWSIRNNDRGFAINDIGVFSLINKSDLYVSSWEVIHLITGVLRDDHFPAGLEAGYCILTLKLIKVTGKDGKFKNNN